MPKLLSALCLEAAVALAPPLPAVCLQLATLSKTHSMLLHALMLRPTRRLVKETSSWNNKKEELAAEQASCEQLTASLAEVDEEGMRAKMKQASEERDAAQAALNRCVCRGRAGSGRADDGGG